jgi:hypothetical protein
MAKNIFFQCLKNIFGLVLVCITIVLFLLLITTSPVWFPLYMWLNPEGAANVFGVTVGDKYFREWYGKSCWAIFVFGCIIMWFVYEPLGMHYPMKKRVVFMREGEKPLHEYSLKNQLGYYHSLDSEGRKSIIQERGLSAEVLENIWQNEPTEREYFISNKELPIEKVRDLILFGNGDLLWKYFKGHTPNKEVMSLLVKYIAQGYASAMHVMVKLISQQRPSGELVGTLLSTKQSRFIDEVNRIVDLYADLDAVRFATSGSIADQTEEEKHEHRLQCWRNFCKSKKYISIAAQKEMSYEQYQIYVETGHRLDAPALQHLCLTIGDADFLREVVGNEFEQIDAAMQTALKTAYWRYSVYLEVKQEKAQAL